MAIDAGLQSYQVPSMNNVTSATPAVSLLVTFVGTGVKGGFLVNEDCDLVEAGATYAIAGTTTAMVFKLQLCRDTQIANAVDIVGLAVGGATSALCTAPAAVTAVGTTINKRYNFRLSKGDVVLFNVTTAPTAAGGYFYANCYPRGEISLPTKLQGTTVVSTVASST